MKPSKRINSEGVFHSEILRYSNLLIWNMPRLLITGLGPRPSTCYLLPIATPTAHIGKYGIGGQPSAPNAATIPLPIYPVGGTFGGIHI